MFTTRRGEQRWTCHGCSNAGTAIDLVMQVRGTDVADALTDLAHRTGIAAAPLPQRSPAAPRPPTAAASQVVPPPRPQPVPALDRYVRDCAAALWRPAGRAMHCWLQTVRGLPDDVLRANRIGADLGPARQSRPHGIPRVRAAVVLPVSVADGAAYLQLRLLNERPGSPRYLNPASGLATNPRLGLYRPAQASEHRELIVTEGIIDALSAAAAGYRSAAILGAGYPDPATAAAIAQLPWPLVVAFDPDPAGTAGAERLGQFLEARHRRATLLHLERGDLNEHLIRHGPRWPQALATAITQTRHLERPGLIRAT